MIRVIPPKTVSQLVNQPVSQQASNSHGRHEANSHNKLHPNQSSTSADHAHRYQQSLQEKNTVSSREEQKQRKIDSGLTLSSISSNSKSPDLTHWDPSRYASEGGRKHSSSPTTQLRMRHSTPDNQWHRSQNKLGQQHHAVRDHRLHRHQRSPPYQDRISNSRPQRHRPRGPSSESEYSHPRYHYVGHNHRYHERPPKQVYTSGSSRRSPSRSRWDSERHTHQQGGDYSSSHDAGSGIRYRSPDDSKRGRYFKNSNVPREENHQRERIFSKNERPHTSSFALHETQNGTSSMVTSNFDHNAARSSIQSRTAPVNSRERDDASTGPAARIRPLSRRQQGKKPRPKQHHPGRRERILAAQLRIELMNKPNTQLTHQFDMQPAHQSSMESAHQYNIQPAHQYNIQPAYQSNMQPAYQSNMQPAYQSNMQLEHSRTAPSEAPTWITVVR